MSHAHTTGDLRVDITSTSPRSSPDLPRSSISKINFWKYSLVLSAFAPATRIGAHKGVGAFTKSAKAGILYITACRKNARQGFVDDGHVRRPRHLETEDQLQPREEVRGHGGKRRGKRTRIATPWAFEPRQSPNGSIWLWHNNLSCGKGCRIRSMISSSLGPRCMSFRFCPSGFRLSFRFPVGYVHVDGLPVRVNADLLSTSLYLRKAAAKRDMPGKFKIPKKSPDANLRGDDPHRISMETHRARHQRTSDYHHAQPRRRRCSVGDRAPPRTGTDSLSGRSGIRHCSWIGRCCRAPPRTGTDSLSGRSGIRHCSWIGRCCR